MYLLLRLYLSIFAVSFPSRSIFPSVGLASPARSDSSVVLPAPDLPITAYIFPASNGKQRRWVSDTFARTVDELGLNDTGEFVTNEDGERVPIKIEDARQRVVFHSLRHTFASWLVQKGTPLYTVAELMGHTTLEMTRRYSHLAPDSLRKAAISLEGSLEE